MRQAMREAWRLAARQHDVIARWQLLELGFTARAIEHRIARGRLHPVFRGVYAVGRPRLTRKGRWMAAVLACGRDAMLSHESAAALRGVRDAETDIIEVTVLSASARGSRGVRVHRRPDLPAEDVTVHDGIPVTGPVRTLLDLAPRLDEAALERAINEADRLRLITVEALRSALDQRPGQRGVAILRKLLDRRTFTLTDSELERRFLPIARSAGLPSPLTRQHVNGFRVDFFWPELGLVAEADGLRYHRTPAQQARDRLRDQAHTAAGLTPLRFTYAQIRYEPKYVEATLKRVARRLTTDAA